jgi:hypothetical protein
MKQMTTGSTGIVIPTQYISQWIDLLRAQSVLQRAGVQTLVMDAKSVTMGAVTVDPAATWHSEGGSISVDNPTFAARTLTAQTLVTRCQASLEVTQDSPDFGMQLAQAMAAELNRVGLEGGGTPPEPRGIKNTTGRSSSDEHGADRLRGDRLWYRRAAPRQLRPCASLALRDYAACAGSPSWLRTRRCPPISRCPPVARRFQQPSAPRRPRRVAAAAPGNRTRNATTPVGG